MRFAVDASALLAVLLDEPDSDFFQSKLAGASKSWISPVNWWEVQVRMQSKYGEAGVAAASAWMEKIGLAIEPVTSAQAAIALSAFALFKGKPARLNLGDCFAYALAADKDVPLLFKGADFVHTDIRPA